LVAPLIIMQLHCPGTLMLFYSQKWFLSGCTYIQGRWRAGAWRGHCFLSNGLPRSTKIHAYMACPDKKTHHQLEY